MQNNSPAQLDRARPVINSFDIFDTLITRSCVEPHKIFEHVELKTSFKGFASHRHQAEDAIAARGAYVLDDIYAEFGRRLGLASDIVEGLKQAEIEAELEHVIPIAENIAKVRDGDILVSDMYLGEAVIRRLLQKAGFDKKVGLYVSSHGKASGAVWPGILKEFRIAGHLGDNLRNDIEVPRSFGITANYTKVSAPNHLETELMRIGLRDVALLCREVRLATPSEDPVTRELDDIQVSLNFPMLLIACVPLARFIRDRGIERVLFSSRDSELWMKLFRKFATKTGLNCEIEYFYTSRLTRRFPSPDYLTYARDRLTEKSLLVDLCGTSWSIAHLFQHLGVAKRPVFLLLHMAKFSQYEEVAPSPDTCEVHSALKVDVQGGSADLELANQAPYASIIDVKRIGTAFVPVLDADTRHASQIELVRRQVRTFDSLIARMDKCDVSGLALVSGEQTSLNVRACAEMIERRHILRSLFAAAAAEDDAEVRRQLGITERHLKKP